MFQCYYTSNKSFGAFLFYWNGAYSRMIKINSYNNQKKEYTIDIENYKQFHKIYPFFKLL